MRKLAIILGILLLSATVLTAQETTRTYSFDRTSHDFGTIRANQAQTTSFKITNDGTSPLVLLDVKISCNCTKVDWPRQPVLPGNSAEIKVTYKDKDPGAFYKTIEVTTNGTPRRAQLRLKGNVE